MILQLRCFNSNFKISALIALSLLSCFFQAGEAFAIEAGGQVRLGNYQRTVDFDKSTGGQSSNDESVLSAQMRMSIYDFSDSDDSIVMDMRDKHDVYGRLETSNYSLSTYNRFQVRELAYKRPFESNRIYFTLGRFSLSEANVLDNDGAEFGYRYSAASRVGAFGGLAPKDVITPYYVDPETKDVNNAQAGVYYSYEKKNGLLRSLYTNNAIAMGPTYNITDKKSHTYFYHMALWNIDPANRLSSYVQQDFSPNSALRRASIAHSYYTNDLRTNLSLIQTNTEDYLVKQDLLDPLVPSAEQSLRLDVRHRIIPRLSMDYSADYSRRTADGKTRTDFALGVVLPKLFTDNGSLRAQYGVRKNYVSRDNYIRGGYDYWNQFFSLSVMHTMSVEEYDDNTKNNRHISTIDGGVYLNDRVRGSLGYQIEKDDKLSASAFFAMVGYRFGKGTVAPIRNKPALFEEL